MQSMMGMHFLDDDEDKKPSRNRKKEKRRRQQKELVLEEGKVLLDSGLFIQLDKQDGRYVAGDVIRGCVVLVLDADVKIRELWVSVHGAASVSWQERRTIVLKGASTVQTTRTTETYLKQSLVLVAKDPQKAQKELEEKLNRVPSEECIGFFCMPKPSAILPPDDDEVLLPAGQHKYPFEFRLPRQLPASFRGKWGQVKYKVIAGITRAWKADAQVEKEFQVSEYMDLNEEPELARPQQKSFDYTIDFLCLLTGRMVVEFSIPRQGYVPGEDVPFFVEVQNFSNKAVYHTRVSLICTVSFNVGDDYKTTVHTLSSHQKLGLPPGQTLKWQEDKLHIPLVPPSTRYAKAIQLIYNVQLEVSYSSWRPDIRSSLPITVGTVPLKKQVVNTYVEMISHS